MRWYDVVNFDNINPKPLLAKEGWLDVDELELRACHSLSTWSGNAWVRSDSRESDGQPDDALVSSFFVPIFSPRLREALQKAQITGIQYLPIRVLLSTGLELGGFSVANVLHCSDALDLQKSNYECFPNDHPVSSKRGKVRDIRKAVLVKSKLEGADLIRLSQYKLALYASERFVRIFEGLGGTGLSFREVATS